MSTTATVAISAGSGLLGVIIGAGIDVLRDRRREKQERQAQIAALGASKREIAAELYEIGAAMRVIANDPGDADALAGFRPMLRSQSRWADLRGTLASDPSYATVHAAYVLGPLIDRGIDGWSTTRRANEAEDCLKQVVKALECLDPQGTYKLRLLRQPADES